MASVPDPLSFAGGAVLTAAVFLFLTDSLPPLVLVPLAGWPVFLCLDVRSTQRLYRLDPGRFSEAELNVLFVALVEKLGFKRAVPAFVALVEIPVFTFAFLIGVPLLGALLSLNPSRLACLSAASAVLAFAHGDAWTKNVGYVAPKKGVRANF